MYDNDPAVKKYIDSNSKSAFKTLIALVEINCLPHHTYLVGTCIHIYSTFAKELWHADPPVFQSSRFICTCHPHELSGNEFLFRLCLIETSFSYSFFSFCL